MRPCALLAAAFLLAACTGQANVPPVTVPVAADKRVPGSYSAMVQGGGWALRTGSPGHVCGGWTFNTDINPAYERAMRDALTQALENVSFSTEILSPEQLKAQGFDAQIVVHQGNAESRFVLLQQLFSSTARSDVALVVIVAIRDERGFVSQEAVIGRGIGRTQVYTCPPIGEAIGTAAQGAVRSLVVDAIAKLQRSLSKRQLAAEPGQ